MDRIRLVCIEQMLEAWLLADERALSRFLTRPSHKIALRRREKRLELIPDPKAKLIKLFKTKGHGPYKDQKHAIRIARKVCDCARMQRSPSFRRFAEAVTGKPLQNHC